VPQAAQFALGHAGIDVTRQHYVAGDSILARAIDEMPWPAAFAGLGSGAISPEMMRLSQPEG